MKRILFAARTAAPALAGLILAACALPGLHGAAPEAPSKMVGDALHDLRTTSGVHILLSYTQDGDTESGWQVDTTATGTVSADGGGIQLREVGAHWYELQPLSAQQQWSGPGADMIDRLKQPAWLVQTPDQLPTPLLDPPEIADLIAPSSSPSNAWKARAGLRAQGQAATELTNGTWDLFVTSRAPHRLLSATTRPSTLVADSFSGVSMTFSHYGETVAVQSPAAAYDPQTPSSLPAFFVPVQNSFRFPACDDGTGCTMSMQLRDWAGPGSGTTATFTVQKEDGSALGSCSTAVPSAAAGGTVTIKCRVVSAAYTAYFDSATSGVQGSVALNSPVYDYSS